jgi:hypothetical protein
MASEKIWHKSYARGVPYEIEFEKVAMPEALTRNAKQVPEYVAGENWVSASEGGTKT